MLPVVAVTTLSPLVVAAICVYAWRRLGGGRHLLFWALGHAALSVPIPILALADWQAGIPLHLMALGSVSTCLAVVLIASGIRVLTGRNDRLLPATGLAIIIGTVIVVLQQTVIPVTSGLPAAFGGATLLYAGSLLIIHRRSPLYIAVGILMIARGVFALSYTGQVAEAAADLSTAFPVAIFVNLLTGLGLIMIEFDNGRRREQQAREDEHRTRQFVETVLDSMPATMTYKDRDLRFRIINRQMRELLTTYGDDLLGRTWSEIAGADAAAVVEEQDRKILATGESLYMEQGWSDQDGRPIVVWALKVPLKDSSGEIQGIVTCGIDITRLKDTETQLIEQREAAEAASRAKSTFLANMSHELRTPLNAIIGFAEMMKEGYLGSLSDRQQEYATHIFQSGEHLLRLVSDLLDLSRLESGKLEINVADCDFDRIAASALAMVEPQARRSDVRLEFEPTGLTLRADERALTQILINLLGNSVKFNRPGGRITLQAASRNGIVDIAVEDTGIGMSDAESRAAIQPLHRVDVYRARANSGAGLGLSICRSLVELHGGRLEIRSRPGAGTTVRIALPA
ncbi:MAG TPA: PAS domain-containing sensor histidine kinase [Ferrovibrio sp.]|jgi:PAS domain S-box-containing protein|uniref:sensor histidine kinase n=1 Tax=Ferrovibrio sp. TaxID=1917215 RepID=UPI002B4B419F|nr:PAS domain-containing sensor histidine kinase [Ferrovibrio sp.]HLT77509.1 PAS domain-containing sensor histidine kinase [Ferrovibrio sp.]